MHTSITSLDPGTRIDGPYRLRQCLLRRTPQGRDFILGEVADASGSIGFVWWNADAKAHEQLHQASYVAVKGRAETYRDRLQVVVDEMRPTPAEEVDTAALDEPAQVDVDATWQLLRELIESVDDAMIRTLLTAILLEDEDIAARFREAPAAVSMHHPWRGGLLAHSVQMALLATDIAARYPRDLDRSLLIAGALLHDLCKIYEFDWDGVVEYTTTGNLVGHIAQGSELVGRFADAIPDFPKLTRLKLQHLILSHHGEPEWGAVKRPVLAEAMVLHHIDNIDARMEAFTRAIAEPGTGDWTDFNKVFNTRLFKGG